jgi:hypothetical protein
MTRMMRIVVVLMKPPLELAPFDEHGGFPPPAPRQKGLATSDSSERWLEPFRTGRELGRISLAWVPRPGDLQEFRILHPGDHMGRRPAAALAGGVARYTTSAGASLPLLISIWSPGSLRSLTK